MSSFLCEARCFVFYFDMRFRLGTSPPPRDCGLCHLSIACWFSPLSRPPRHDVACGGVLAFVFLVFVPVFYFNSPFFVSPPRHADDTRAGFDGGCSCHSALSSGPPATLAVRGRFSRMVYLFIVSAFPSITFLGVFSGFIARSFRGVGVGFEEPHLRFMV